jgi:hypothetical protein
MIELEDSLRTALRADAETQPAPLDLATRSMRDGRRMRRRRQSGLVAAVLASVAGLIAAVVVVTAPAGSSTDQTITPAGHGSSAPSSSTHSSGTPWWKSWTQNRVYGAMPPQSFYRPLSLLGQPPRYHHMSIYAGATAPDGTEFVLYLVRAAGDAHDASWATGVGPAKAPFSDTAGRPYPDAPYLAFQARAVPSGTADHRASWLIVAGHPGTVAASYSANGTGWRPMKVQQGIGLIKLPRFAPAEAQIRLSDSNGRYYQGRLFPA